MQRQFVATLRLKDEFSNGLRRARSSLSSFGTSSRTTARETGAFGRSLTSAGAAARGPFSRGLFTAEGRLRSLDKTMGFAERRARGLFRYLRYGAIGGGFGLTAAFGGAIAAGFRFNAQMEQNEIAFSQFLGSTKAARRELEFLNKLQAQTPFDMPGITTAARKLLGFGFSVRDTNKYLKIAADTSSGLGGSTESIESIVRAFGQIQAKNRLSAEELNQLAEVGVPAYKIIRQELHLTDKQMASIGTNGIAASRAIPALARGMERLYGGASARQAQTFLGLWSTFKASATTTLGAVTKSFFDESKNWLRGANRVSDEIAGIFEGSGSFSEKMRRSWGVISSSLEDWFSTDGRRQIAAAFGKAGEFTAGLVNTIFGIGRGGSDNVWSQAGGTALKSFARGFKETLASGDILTSPIGRVLEAYFGIKLWRRLTRGRGGAAPGGGPVEALTQLGATPANAMWVRFAGGVPGVPGVPGGGGLGTPIPVPGGAGKAGGKLASKLPGWAAKARGFARGPGPLVIVPMILDAAFRKDHDPLGGMKDLLRSLGVKDEPLLKTLWQAAPGHGTHAVPKDADPTTWARTAATRDQRKRTRTTALDLLLPRRDAEAAGGATLRSVVAGVRREQFRAKEAGKDTSGAIAKGMRSASTEIETASSSLARAAQTSFLSGGAPGFGATPTGYIAGTVAGGAATGDAPGGGPAYNAGLSWGRQVASAYGAGAAAGIGNPLGLPTLADLSGAGAWGGTMDPVMALARSTGLPITSQKRDKKFTASGGISDHWVGSTNAYATDLGVTSRTQGDPIAQSLAVAIGGTWTPGQWLNTNAGGMRWQLGWQVPDHFDHIHLGARRLHGGGVFNAPSRGGEGYALLRDRERVLPASATPRAAGAQVHITFAGPVVDARGFDGDVDALADRVGRRVAEQVEEALDNISIAAVTS
jgi:tape measure domain-containing protein